MMTTAQGISGDTAESPEMGIFQIRNKVNQKIYVGCSDRLDHAWDLHKSRLDGGVHPNGELQSDYHKMGPDNFSFEIIEKLDPNDAKDVSIDLDELEKKALNSLQPYESRGYNKLPIA